MKKSLALILALVMLVGSLFAVIPMAEGEETPESSYTPEIAYANLNYTDAIHMMFAVPAPTSLEDGAVVKLLFWTSREDSLAFSYSDPAKIVLDAETTKATIGGKEHLVFKYSDLGAHQMTDVVCARPVLVKDDKAIAYGELVDYSILEYVAGARGEIDGVAGLSSDKAAVLENFSYMLDFGAATQKVYDEKYDYYANDELRQVYVTPVVKGVTLDRVFSGFFKPEEDDYFTLQAPFFDGTSVAKVFDANGAELEDLDIFSDGYQLAATDADINITVQYSNMAVKHISAETLGPDFEVNNYDEGVVGGNIGYVVYTSPAAIMINGVGFFNFSTKPTVSNHYWNSVKTIRDPAGSDKYVMQMTGTHIPQFVVKLENPFSAVGVGDTIEPAFTIEMELGSNGIPANTGIYIIRHRVKSPTDAQSASGVNIFKVIDGVLYLHDGSGYNAKVGDLPMNDLRKFALVVDPVAEKIYGYAEDENGEMVKTAETPFAPDAYFKARQNAYLSDPETNSALAPYADYRTFFLESTQEFTLHIGASKGKGKFDDLMSGSVFTDMNAVKERAEAICSFLMDNYTVYAGRGYN